METSDTGPASAAQSATRWSMPSYRPQAKTRPGSGAHSAAMAGVNGWPAGGGQPALGGPLGSHGLRERLAGGGRHDEPGARRPDVVQRAPPGLGTHDHARAAAVRGVVDGAVDVVGPLAEGGHADGGESSLRRLAEQRLPERSQVLGKDRDDVDAEAHRSRSPSGGSTTRNPPSTSTVGTIAETKGTSASGASWRRITSRSCASCRTPVT